MVLFCSFVAGGLAVAVAVVEVEVRAALQWAGDILVML
jgi:hypothetical protein